MPSDTNVEKFRTDAIKLQDMDELPYGAILVDGKGMVHCYNRAESEISGLAEANVLGRNFFTDIAPCTNLPAFRGRFEEGVARGRLDVMFEFVFDFAFAPLRVYIEMAETGEPDRYLISVHPRERLTPFQDSSADTVVEDRLTEAGARVIDKTLCDREPIHLPGAIQPHGAVLVIDVADPRIGMVSANVVDILERSPAELLGRPLAAVFPEEEAVRLEELAAEASRGVDPQYLWHEFDWTAPRSGLTLRASAHVHDHRLILEVEPWSLQVVRAVASAHGTLHRQVVAGASLRDGPEVVRLFLDKVREVTGFQRVILYRFDAKGHGLVFGESLEPDSGPSLFGLNFPASDIPRQARALYARNRIRAIPNNGYQPVTLVSSPSGGEAAARPVDLSFATLRSMSPVHRAYLDNMNVTGSFSVSVVYRGRLWGLLIGHDRRPRYIAPEMMRVISAAAENVATQIETIEVDQSERRRAEQVAIYRRLIAKVIDTGDFRHALTDGAATLNDLFDAVGGAACRIGIETRTIGTTPPEEEITSLVSFLRETTDDDIWQTDSISSYFVPWYRHRRIASGVTVVFIGEERADALVWFRPETPRTMTWAGSPLNQSVDKRGMVLPRRSFERWTEEFAAHSRPWEPWTRDLADELRHGISDLLAGQMRRLRAMNLELERARETQERFIANMNHELRTPLNAIIGFAEMMAIGLGGRLNDAHRGYVEDILNAGRHLLDLVNDILDFTRLRSGIVTLRPEILSVSEEIAGILSLMRGRANGAGVVLLSNVSEDIRLTADRRGFRQVLLNLVSNALKFNRHGGRVDVTAAADGRDLVIEVVDTGVGIPEEHLTKVAEPFQRVEDPMTHPAEGTGLGLSIVDILVKGHGGRMDIASSLGEGTTVRVRLPLDGLGMKTMVKFEREARADF